MTPVPLILIVEDEAIVANDIKETLLSLGYGIAGTAKYAESALEKIAETQPDLVLMDIHLAGPMDGIEAAGMVSLSFFSLPMQTTPCSSGQKLPNRTGTLSNPTMNGVFIPPLKWPYTNIPCSAGLRRVKRPPV
jgi:hypothetical protein